MNIKSLKAPARRVETSYDRRLGIQAYGDDNLYPQKALEIAMSSPNGRQCLERYAKFIEGDGLEDKALAITVVNRHGQTMRDLHHLVSRDLANFSGFALHLNYDVYGQIIEIQHEPFENCRLEESDDTGYISHIITHVDWSGKTTRGGNFVRVNAENIEQIDVFAPKKVFEQMDAVGGIAYYNGQIQWNSIAGWRRYPTAKYDGALTDLSTDEGLSNVKNRNVRNNFLPAGMIITKRGSQIDGETPEDNGYTGELVKFQGDANALKLLEVEVDATEEAPEFKPIEGANLDKMFTATTESVIDNIYSAFNQEVFLSIRKGKIGFSGDLVRDAWDDYAAQVREEQHFISSAYAQIFAYWAGEKFDNFNILSCRFGGTNTVRE